MNGTRSRRRHRVIRKACLLLSWMGAAISLPAPHASAADGQPTADPGTPSYVRLDLGMTWRPTKNLELSIWEQNLLHDRHSEFISYHASFLTEVPRGIVGKVSWRF